MVATEQRELAITSGDSVIAAPTPVKQSQPSDLRHLAMSLPIEQQQVILAEYKERRDHFRQWLLSQLQEGSHFGFPPGCAPKTQTIEGKLHYGVWSKGAEGGKGSYTWYPEEQWRPKPTLYAAGADFVCDLLGIRPEYEADEAGWRQLGYDKGDKKAFVYKCKLYSKSTGEYIGEGLGARLVGQKGGDVNNSLKMCLKAAKVCAVLDRYGLRDLFTQDEPAAPPEYDNPPQNENAPKSAPRHERITKQTLNQFFGRFKSFLNPDAQPHDFMVWLQQATGRATLDFTQPANWTPEMAKIVDDKLRQSEPPQ